MATQKQKDALEKARTKRLNKIYGKQYAELIAKNKRLLAQGEKHISFENIKARIAKAQAEHERLTGKKLSRAAAIKKITLSQVFLSSSDIYKRAVIDYMKLGDKNTLRSYLALAKGTKYKETTINWNTFHYDKITQALVDSETGVSVKIVKGADSTQEDFVEVLSAQ